MQIADCDLCIVYARSLIRYIGICLLFLFITRSPLLFLVYEDITLSKNCKINNIMKNPVTVFVGDVGKYLSKLAEQYDSSASLITSENYEDINENGVYYFSLGDLDNLEQFSSVLRQSDIIYYSPPPNNKWTNKNIKKWTEDYLSVFSMDIDKKIYNFDDKEKEMQQSSQMLHLYDHRKTDSPQIWISGCSISHGDGVLPNQKYGSLFAEKMAMPVSFLTCSGSSIPWSADQILRSDIRKNDIVVWGLTSPNRISFWNEDEQKVQHCTMRQFSSRRKGYYNTIVKEKYLLSEHVVYESLKSIETVTKFLEKEKVKLIMAILLPGIEKYLMPRDNLLMLTNIFGRDASSLLLDIGDDGLHPGPLTHKFYYEKILKKYYELHPLEK